MDRIGALPRVWLKSALLLLSGVVVGLIFTLRVGAAPRGTTLPTQNITSDISVSRVLELRDRQQELKSQLTLLRDEQKTLQGDATANQVNFEDIRTQIDAQTRLAGLAPLLGPGVTVLIDDSSLAPGASGDANRYIVHQQQLVTLVGVLWNAEAEAIAINDQRVTDRTSIYCVGSTIMINQEFLAPPFTVRAIGDPAKLEDAVLESPLLADLWNRQEQFGLLIDVKPKNQVQVPAYTGSISNNAISVEVP